MTAYPLKDFVCTKCNSPFQHNGRGGMIHILCAPCVKIKRSQYFHGHPRERVKCVDCGARIDKERGSRRRTCSACYAQRQVAKGKRATGRGETRRVAAREKIVELAKKYPWLHPDLTADDRAWLRRKLDPTNRIRGQIAQKVGASITGKRTKANLEKLLGYSLDELRAHLEKQFADGMTWAKYATGELHIDHILPLARFDLSKEEEVRAAWALPNLRPMWAAENIAKGARRVLLL